MAIPIRFPVAAGLLLVAVGGIGACSRGVDGGTTGSGGSVAGTGGGQASGGASNPAGGGMEAGGVPLGDPVEGEYNLGPVEWEGSFWNACAPYPASIQALNGELLAGLSNEVAADGGHCDACVQVTTKLGHTVIARVITYGVSMAPGNIDLSQATFDALTEGEYPRTMEWQLVTCPEDGPLYVQFQTGANEWWTSFWVRNPRILVDRVEVKSASHADFVELPRGTDGTFTDGGGFGPGPFTLRIVAVDGTTIEETFDGFEPGALLTASKNL